MRPKPWGVHGTYHAPHNPTHICRCALILVWIGVSFVGGACSAPTVPTPTPAPTITLIPATTTPTPTPTVPTATTPPRIDPNDLPQTATPVPMTPSSNNDLDPVAAELLLLARQRVAVLAELDATDAIEVETVEPYRWPDGGLGCPLPDLTYPDGEVDGYRIVLAVEDDVYIFHTSFTDLVRCDPENVALPGAPTPEDDDDS